MVRHDRRPTCVDTTYYLLAYLERPGRRFSYALRLTLRSEEHTSELQSRPHLVCRLLFEKKSWHMLKQRTRLAWKSKWKRLNWDLRAVGVFYVHLVLFAIAVTVLTWIFQWMTDTIFMVFD